MGVTPVLSTDANKNGTTPTILANAFPMPTPGSPVVPGTGGQTLALILLGGTQVLVIGQAPAFASGGVNHICTDAESVRVDPTGGTLTVFLTANPYDGMRCSVKDVAGNASTNNITVRASAPTTGPTPTIERADIAPGTYVAGASGTVMGTNGMAVTWEYDAGRNKWEIVAKVAT